MENDINKLINRMMAQANNSPEDDFDGFSPSEMHQILYFPFSDNNPIQFNTQLSDDLLKLSPIFNIVIDLLNLIDQSNGIKLTAKGNLPQKVMKAIYAKEYWPDQMIEKGITKMRREEDWLILHVAKGVLQLSKIARKYNNKLILTKTGQKHLDNTQWSKLFYEFFQTHTTKYNWAYTDRYENEKAGQFGLFYLLHIVNKYGKNFKNISFYTEYYFKAFPMFDQHEETTKGIKYRSSENVIHTRFFERFAHWFGLIEVKYEKGESYFDTDKFVKKTKLLSSLLGPT